MTAADDVFPQEIGSEGTGPGVVGQEEEEEPVDPDEVAGRAPIDPTPQEVDEYRELIGDEGPEPGA